MMPSAAVYARMHREFLEKHHPETYRTLKESGELASHVASVGRTALETYEDLEGQMRLKILAKPEDDFMKRVKKLEAIPLQVEEIVLHDVVFNPTP